MLSNGLSRYDEALTAAGQASAGPDELGLATWSLAELIEAAARTGAVERAADALRRLSQATSAAGTDWALGIQARSQALLSGAEHAERLYLEAIERLGRTRIRAELARAHSSTASGCAARAAAGTRETSCAPPTRCWTRWG